MMRLTRIPRHIGNIRRARDIVQVLMNHGFAEVLTRAGLMRRASVRWMLRRRDTEELPTAKRFVAALQDLGPTFVKFGQILSARPDILPASWIDELVTLQDNVTPVPSDDIVAQVESSLGQPLSELYETFDTIPLATASIGQVHVATLIGGRKVVVKVLRPGIEEVIRNDVDLMGVFAGMLERGIPELRSFRPTGVVEEFERAIMREIDFTSEARNAERFRRNFADDDRIVVPEVISSHSSQRVLTLEFIDGIKVTKYEKYGNDPKVMARLGLEVIFKTAFVHGFFHADPHPGNIWALPDNRLALLDLGMADFVLPDTRDFIVDLMFAVITEDADRIADVVYKLADSPEDIEYSRFKRDLVQIYEDHVRGMPLKDIHLAELIASCLTTAQRHRIIVPTEITLLLKALGTVEGVGKVLDPDLDLIKEARPYVMQVVSTRWGPKRISKDVAGAMAEGYELMIHLPTRVNRLLDRVERGSLRRVQRIEGLQDAARRVEAAGTRVALGLLVVALTIGSAMLFDHPTLQYKGISLVGGVGFSAAAFLASWMIVSILIDLARRRSR